jgi:hypothetical protein
MGEKFKKALSLVRKLGILRYGTTTYKYTSGKDMPAQALFDDVYDEEKDLVTKKDRQHLTNKIFHSNHDQRNFCPQCGAKLTPETSLCPDCKCS